MSKNIYITTPVFYPTDDPHIGHAFTVIFADFLTRFYQQRKHNVFFLTGTDEHGKKILEKSKQNNKDVTEFVNENVLKFKLLWEKLNINYTYFSRTTSDKHETNAKNIWNILYEKNLIYLNDWVGYYCTQCEENYSDIVAKENDFKCNIGHSLEKQNEKTYFFRFSSFQDWIKEKLIENKDFIIFPQHRATELINSFLNTKLSDLSVSRTTFDWGIKIPQNTKHVMYVWLDALMSYLTGLDFPNQSLEFNTYWNSNDSEIIHIMSKEITRFHCIYWPIVLHELNVKLPTKIISHGWIVDHDGRKMSKSLKNIINPAELLKEYEPDAIRYYLLHEVSLINESRCSERLLNLVYNNDLANNIGNLVSRVQGLLAKYSNKIIPNYESCKKFISDDMINMTNETIDNFEKLVLEYKVTDALKSIIKFIMYINKQIEVIKPWELYKKNEINILSGLLYFLCQIIRVVFALLLPVMPEKSKIVYDSMNFSHHLFDVSTLKDFGKISGIKIKEQIILYQRNKEND